MVSLYFFNPVLAAESGENLFNQLCVSCHTNYQGKKVEGVAPPIFAVVRHVKMAYPEREDFIQQVVDWVDQPDKEVALMQGAIKKFGLMPKLPYSQDDVRKIAEFLYDNKMASPNWFGKHFKEKHLKE